jgi:hypothetical protein
VKLWLRLTLTFIGLALVCLLLNLSQPAGLHHPSQVAGSGPWLDRGREPASDAPTVSIVRSMEFDPARAGPFGSLVLDFALTAGNISPPGQETLNRWALGESPVKPATQTNAIEQPFPLNYRLSTAELENRGFATASS